MLLTKRELKFLEKQLVTFANTNNGNKQLDIWSDVIKNPGIMLSCGFDEMQYVVVENKVIEDQSRCQLTLKEIYHDIYSGAWFTPTLICTYNEIDCSAVDLLPGNIYKEIPNFELTEPVTISFVPYENNNSNCDFKVELNLSNVVEKCQSNFISQEHPASLILLDNSIPSNKIQCSEISEITKNLLLSIKNDKIAIKDLQWWQVEDIVAELFRNQGLDVKQTSRTRDGGRDLIVRFPGCPFYIAVEVKHMKTVGVKEIRNSIMANRHFPQLMFVTTGIFSAGVNKEYKNKDEFFYRLQLYNGLALNQWIINYPNRFMF